MKDEVFLRWREKVNSHRYGFKEILLTERDPGKDICYNGEAVNYVKARPCND
jgi:hypothetical protein